MSFQKSTVDCNLLPGARMCATMQGLLGGAGMALGVAAGVMPRSLNLRIMGAVSELAQEVYNDQLREVRHSTGWRCMHASLHAS